VCGCNRHVICTCTCRVHACLFAQTRQILGNEITQCGFVRVARVSYTLKERVLEGSAAVLAPSTPTIHLT
jgi:hypothetical protein